MTASEAKATLAISEKGVVIVGGGVAGIQASLDLARAGARVYLVERSPSVGGRMAQLDKTLPTNDCSICILSPLLVECARHERIDLITLAEIEEVSGSAGDFTVTIVQHPRYVDPAKCTACGDCGPVCPVEITSEFEAGLVSHKAAYRPYPQAVPNVFSIMKGKQPPCNARCPAGLNVHGYVSLIGSGKFREAYELIKEAIPFPAVCGRVCYSPCEEACNRNSLDQGVSIRALKRFVSDYVWKCEADGGGEAEGDSDLKGSSQPAARRRPAGVLPPGGKRAVHRDRIAVVGSGPAGMSAAWRLARQGYPVTVFEALGRPGGMLRVGIPRYRLPADVLDKEIEAICGEGVELRLNQRVDDVRGLLDDGYGAVCVAVGAHKTSRVGIDGEDLDGVFHGLDFLRRVNLGEIEHLSGSVTVIGGGNAAIDAARTARRLGASPVRIAYRRSRQEMPGYHAEIEAAVDEGIALDLLVGPVAITGNGNKAKKIHFIRMKLGEPDSSGRRRPVPIEGSEFTIETDIVILAISQQPDTGFLAGKVDLKPDGTVKVDPVTLQTTLKGVFAAGDAVTGPYTVIDAIRSGYDAAESIHRYLDGVALAEDRKPADIKMPQDELAQVPPFAFEPLERCSIPTIATSKRTSSFAEVEEAFSAEQAVEEATRCLHCGACCSCMECVKACEAEAVIHEDRPHHLTVRAAAIIVATGFDEMDPTPIKNLGYAESADVITGLQFERILNAAGPTRGRVVRPSDGRTPRSIAFVQCAGSRDERYHPYCSRVCCVYSVKQCIVAKDHEQAIEDFFYFYRDLRAYGRGFEEFCMRGRDKTGITMIRSSPASITCNGGGTLAIRFEDPGTARPSSVDVDMVVLACAMKPSAGTNGLARVLGAETDCDGFFKIDDPLSDPVSSTREGILVCGCACGPRDIPDSVAQASAASAKALGYLGAARRPLEEKPLPETDPDAEPRVGVFVCHCGLNIGRVVDSHDVAEYAKALPGVVFAEDTLYTCSDDTQKRIGEAIEEFALNRVVVAACTPRTHEPIFRQTCADAGLNPYLFEMANIRDQCSWVHADQPQDATDKARDLVRMAVSRARLLRPLQRKRVQVTRSALIVGGGISGIQCAIDLARLGIKVHLVEKEASLGGYLKNLALLFPSGRQAEDLLKAKLDQLKGLPIELLTSARIESIEGFVGNFTVGVDGREIKTGAIILATGATTLVPEHKFGYGTYDNVMTSADFESALQATESLSNKNIAFIQCVGAREKEGYTGCSRYCCQVTLKQALEAVRKGAEAAVIHRDVRAFTRYGEDLYRQARLEGVHFIRRGDEGPIDVGGDGQVDSIGVFDVTLLSDVKLECDMLVLAVPMVPCSSTAALSEMARVPLGQDGFFLEKHVKLGPLETNTEGIFLCGCSQYPKDIPDSLAQASGVAAKAGALLARPYLTLEPATAVVRRELCRTCGTCVEICEYHAPEVVEEAGERYIVINEALCKGCGTCAAHCPTGAITARHFRDVQIQAMIDALLTEREADGRI